MKIYSMTATFGKLRHETLTLQPGLNIIHAPNEWGKSTWCAFLLAMLYGLDTRAKSTKIALADKERYVPWAGEPMAGRMDICWNGRDITIERKTKGRIPMGDFRAYETETGLEVPELTAANCGTVLLGVERSVFQRSGFIRFRDMAVTEDESLRSRLNALVTTGDERGTGEKLARDLRELKNRIRYNKSGLLPRAEGERAGLEAKLRELESLQALSENTGNQLREMEKRQLMLENHRTALAYAAAREDARQVDQARKACEQARALADRADESCRGLPPREKIESVLGQIRLFQQRQARLQQELRLLPEETGEEAAPGPFGGLEGEQAREKARTDGIRYQKLRNGGSLLWIIPLLLILTSGALALWKPVPGLICCAAAVLMLAAAVAWRINCRRKAARLEAYYGSHDPEQWMALADAYAREALSRQHAAGERDRRRRQLTCELEELRRMIREATNGQELEDCARDWERASKTWDVRDNAYLHWQQAENHCQTLKSMARSALPPEYPDEMSCGEAETARLLDECAGERHRLENRLGQYQGRMEALGCREKLEAALSRSVERIRKLEETYGALMIAQETLAEAAAQLQRRFAPRISKRAQELMGRMTGGRYDRVSLDLNLSLWAGAQQEDTLRETLWRSDGTVDQLYLALRLAVSEELTPEAPLILDDALVRFDDERLKSALEILREEAAHKQVLLFTCQNREIRLL